MMKCPRCDSSDLFLKQSRGLERIIVFLTSKRRYRCAACGQHFRGPDDKVVPISHRRYTD